MFHLWELGAASAGRCAGLATPVTSGGGSFPPDVVELHRLGREVTIGRVVFLPTPLARTTGCFAVEFLTLTRVRWYAWTPDDRVWELDESSWYSRAQSFEVFLHSALADHRAQLACDDQRFREKCVGGRYVASPETTVWSP